VEGFKKKIVVTNNRSELNGKDKKYCYISRRTFGKKDFWRKDKEETHVTWHCAHDER